MLVAQPHWEAGLLSVSWFETGVELLQGGGWGKGEVPQLCQELVEGTGDMEMGEVKCGLPQMLPTHVHVGDRLWWERLASCPVLRPWCSLGPLGTGLERQIWWQEEDQSPGLVRGGGRRSDTVARRALALQTNNWF